MLKKALIYFGFSLAVTLLLTSALDAQVPSNSLLWLDASQLSSGRISSWPDKSGNENIATISEEGARPSLHIDPDGIRSVRFIWGQYLSAPSVFPTLSDYTIVAVVRLHDTNATSNILSGDHRAYWFEDRAQPAIAHDDRFQQKGISERSVREGFNIIVAQYREETGMAIHYSNGQFGDSLWVDTNHDSTIYVGSYGKSYFANCDIAEILLYERVLMDKERTEIESHLFTKYDITPPPVLPTPESTFTELPQNMQLYPRDLENHATVPISGRITATGWDSITVSVLRGGAPHSYESAALKYTDGQAPFSFRHRIRSELQNYTFEIRVKSIDRDSLLAVRENVVAGDVYLIGGASNAVFGAWSWRNENEFCRTFGMNASRNPRDTMWTVSQVDPWGAGPSVSGWGAKMQDLIASRYQTPTAIINWSVGGTILVHHLKKPGPDYDLRTIYGRLLYRLDKAGVRKAVKAHIFWHGELHDPAGYEQEFEALYDSLRVDIPSIRKTYIMQLRPSYCSNIGNMMLREQQRMLPERLPDLETIATTAIPGYDGCHFTDEGMINVGERVYRAVARDFYHATDTAYLRSPTLRKAYYQYGNYDQITLEFEPRDQEIHVGSDGDFDGAHASIRDYFFLDTVWGKIDGVYATGNRVFLHLSEPIDASTISYLPDRYYHGTPIVYQGPWLTNQAGIGAFAFQNVPLTMKLGVRESAESKMAFFPNPVSDVVRLNAEFEAAGDVAITLFDATGRIVLREQFESTYGIFERELDLRHITPGAYTMLIDAGGERRYHKLLKE